MSYSVQFTKETKRKIAEWRLAPEGMRAILVRLDELSDTPSRRLLRIASSAHVLETDVVFRDPGPPERDCLITLSVRYGVDEETLYIVDCFRLFEDEPV